MGELKIRAVRSPSGEAESRYAVIDTFEEITNGKPYFCGCEVFTAKYNNGMTIRGIEMEKLKLDKKDDINPIEACEDDIFEKVDIPLYLGLSQALKNDGYVFNKKLARLYKNPKGKTD
jgi:hypothetical protein